MTTRAEDVGREGEADHLRGGQGGQDCAVPFARRRAVIVHILVYALV